MKVTVYTLDSFAKTKEGGNAAGVVLEAEALAEKDMQRVAAILGFSETAFVLPSDEADFRVRFFTPTEEVDLCGHATIATFFAMAELGRLAPGSYTQETKAGILGITIQEDHSVMMEQPIPSFTEIIEKEEIAASLHIPIGHIVQELPVQIVSTGLRDIMVPIVNRKCLYGIQPDMDHVKEISRKYKAVGYHVFTLDTLYQSTAHCRNFAPLYDIPEEAATGTSNGALGCYLYQYGKVTKEQASDLIFEQGYSMQKPSEIRVSLGIEDSAITKVRVGGIARNIVKRELELS